MTLSVKDLDSVFIVGCGDIGRRVADLWRQETSAALPLYGLVRTPASAARLQEPGLHPVLADLDQPDGLPGNLPLSRALVYYFTPPPKQGIEDPRMTNFLAAIAENNLPAKFVYLSTSGVYGDQQGQCIDETTPPRPKEDRAKRRYAAELAVREWGKKNRVPVVTLRVGGIYGPGRLPVKRIKAGTPIIHEHLAPATNRIHADDLARVCMAAAFHGRDQAIYNVSDGSRGNMTDYFNQIADFLGLPRPPTIDWDEAEKILSPGMLSYLKESRQLDNRRMLEDLHVRLRYPDLKSGLASCRPDLQDLQDFQGLKDL